MKGEAILNGFSMKTLGKKKPLLLGTRRSQCGIASGSAAYFDERERNLLYTKRYHYYMAYWRNGSIAYTNDTCEGKNTGHHTQPMWHGGSAAYFDERERN